MTFWTSLQAEWSALGDTGQAVALMGFVAMYAVAAVVGLRYAFRGAIAHPDEVTDASHSPIRGGWVGENYTARDRAEKEAKNG